MRFSVAAVPFADWYVTSPGPLFGFGLDAIGQLISNLTGMVTDNTFERFPNLKVVSVEIGCGSAPYLMDHLEVKYEMFRELTGLKQLFSAYICSNCYFIAEPIERNVGAALELMDPDRILKGSDYPHIDGPAEAGQKPTHWIALERNARELFG